VTSTTGVPVNIKITTTNRTYAISNPGKLSTSYFTTSRYKSFNASPTKMPPYYQTVNSPDVEPHGAVAVIKMFSGKIPERAPNRDGSRIFF
jgi:hypothetical protein